MIYHFRVHKDERKGYWAESIELDGCRTQGDSWEELRRNMKYVLDLFLDEPADSKMMFAKPMSAARASKLKGKIVAIPLDPQIAMAMQIRQTRLKAKKTQQEVAKLMGMANISAYQKLEKSKTCNPGILTLAKLKKALPELTIDEIFEA